MQKSYTMTKMVEELSVIILAGDHLRASESKHRYALTIIQNKGVAFNDIRKHLEKQCKRAGLWKQIGAEMEYKPLAKVGERWSKDVLNFLAYVSRNWEKYDQEKVKVEKSEEEKIKAFYKSMKNRLEVLEMDLSPAVFEELKTVVEAKTA